MLFKSIIIIFSLISVFCNTKVAARKSSRKPIFSELVRNISRVNHLLQELINNYIRLDTLSKPKNEDTDYRTDTEIEELFDGKANNRAKNRADDRPATKSNIIIPTPLYFSDFSRGADSNEDKTKEIEEANINEDKTKEIEGADSNEDKTKDIEEADNIPPDSGDAPSTDTTSKSDNSSDEVLTGRHREVNELPDPKILVIHLASSKNPERKLNERKVKPKLKTTIKKKIQKSKELEEKDLFFSEEKPSKKRIVLRANSDESIDVCNKAVVKKCTNALSAVLKDTCSNRRKCASEFKNDFKTNTVTACTNKFKGSGCRAGQNIERTGDRLMDLKKQYLRMTCLRTMTEMQETPASADRPVYNDDPKFKHVNILRDKYEKACQKKVYSKCREACTYVVIKTCKAHECVKDKEKFMDTACRKRCRESYKFTGIDSEDTESDSSSSTSSD